MEIERKEFNLQDFIHSVAIPANQAKQIASDAAWKRPTNRVPSHELANGGVAPPPAQQRQQPINSLEPSPARQQHTTPRQNLHQTRQANRRFSTGRLEAPNKQQSDKTPPPPSATKQQKKDATPSSLARKSLQNTPKQSPAKPAADSNAQAQHQNRQQVPGRRASLPVPITSPAGQRALRSPPMSAPPPAGPDSRRLGTSRGGNSNKAAAAPPPPSKEKGWLSFKLPSPINAITEVLFGSRRPTEEQGESSTSDRGASGDNAEQKERKKPSVQDDEKDHHQRVVIAAAREEDKDEEMQDAEESSQQEEEEQALEEEDKAANGDAQSISQEFRSSEDDKQEESGGKPDDAAVKSRAESFLPPTQAIIYEDEFQDAQEGDGGGEPQKEDGVAEKNETEEAEMDESSEDEKELARRKEQVDWIINLKRAYYQKAGESMSLLSAAMLANYCLELPEDGCITEKIIKDTLSRLEYRKWSFLGTPTDLKAKDPVTDQHVLDSIDIIDELVDAGFFENKKKRKLAQGLQPTSSDEEETDEEKQPEQVNNNRGGGGFMYTQAPEIAFATQEDMIDIEPQQPSTHKRKSQSKSPGKKKNKKNVRDASESDIEEDDQDDYKKQTKKQKRGDVVREPRHVAAPTPRIASPPLPPINTHHVGGDGRNGPESARLSFQGRPQATTSNIAAARERIRVARQINEDSDASRRQTPSHALGINPIYHNTFAGYPTPVAGPAVRRQQAPTEEVNVLGQRPISLAQQTMRMPPQPHRGLPPRPMTINPLAQRLLGFSQNNPRIVGRTNIQPGAPPVWGHHQEQQRQQQAPPRMY